MAAAETGSAFGSMVRKLSIDRFENEDRSVCYGTAENEFTATELFNQQRSFNTVSKKVKVLL